MSDDREAAMSPPVRGGSYQCRCLLDDSRCKNDVSIDQPFCDICEDRHPMSSHPVSYVPIEPTMKEMR